jgi:hypothetical protein
MAGAQVLDSISLPDRSEVLNRALTVRYDRIADTVPVDACELLRAFDGDPDFRRHLRSWVAERVSRDSLGTSCARGADRQPPTKSGWYFRRMERDGPDEVIVRAAVVRGSSTWTEVYKLRRTHRPDQTWGDWYVDELRLTDFVES